MPIALGGIGSGIDTTSLVDQLVATAQEPVTQVTTQKAAVDSASQTVSSLSTKLAALKTAALALSTSVGFSSFASTSSDPAIVASATGSAGVGTYNVTVSALASAQKTRSTTFASSTTALNMGGQLGLKMGTADPIQITIADADTLSDIAAKISNSGARVSASVLNDGTTSRIVVQGLDSGSDANFSLTENGQSLGFGNAGATYQVAQNAALTVDGLPITSKTNSVTGVIPGVNLALTKTTTGPVTIGVTTDTAAVKTKVNALVTAYNDFVNAGHTASGYGSTAASNSVLAADPSVRTALHQIGALMGNAIPGATGAYSTMWSIGLTTSQDGLLSLDSTKFDAAMSADPTAVRKLFVTEPVLGATGLMKTLMSSVDSLITGSSSPLQARIDSLSSQSKRLADSQTKMQARVDDYKANLTKQFTAMDQLVAKYKAQATQVSSTFGDSSNGNGQ